MDIIGIDGGRSNQAFTSDRRLATYGASVNHAANLKEIRLTLSSILYSANAFSAGTNFGAALISLIFYLSSDFVSVRQSEPETEIFKMRWLMVYKNSVTRDGRAGCMNRHMLAK